MRRLLTIILAAAGALALAPPVLHAAPPPIAAVDVPDVVHGEVIVGFDRDASGSSRDRVARAAEIGLEERIGPRARRLEILDGDSVRATIAELRGRRAIDYAVPNHVVQAAGFVPDDPGRMGGSPGDWQELQWNFAGRISVRAPGAWEIARQRDAGGARGVTVAVIDSGAAYLGGDGFVRAPDLSARRWVDPRDYVDGDDTAYDEGGDGDELPNYGRGHGTHVSGTIRQATNNGKAVTGLAYGSRLMPIRVLDVNGFGDTASLARGLAYAARHGADVINMSLETRGDVSPSAAEPLADAVKAAHEEGAVVVAAAGNGSRSSLSPPASLKHVIAVGATTDNGCLADYSNRGDQVDLVAPGGGDDVSPGENAWERDHCRPAHAGRPIFQQTYDCRPSEEERCRTFGLPPHYDGTSMAAPHVSAAAALVMATGHSRDPDAVELRLERTAQDLGKNGPDGRYAAGLLNASAAVR